MSPRTTARLAWALVALSVALLLGGIALSHVASSTVPDRPLGGEAGDSSVVTNVTNLLTLLPFSVVGAIIVSRHPRNTIGWIFCSIGLAVGIQALTTGYAEYWLASGSGSRSLGETAAWFSTWSWIPVVAVPTSFLLLLFPDGSLPSPRWRPIAWCAGLGITGFVVGYALEAGPLEEFPQIVNPYGVDSPLLGIVAIAAFIVVVGSMVASAVSLIVRHRRAGSEQRQQIKWLAYGGTVVVGTIFVAGTAPPFISGLNYMVSIVIISVALLGLPIFTGIAIVRHRLYDIDIIINRTLVYGSLTVTLVFLYFGGIVVLQRLFVLLTGEKSTLAVVASTLAIAALFSPLRRRVQGFVDRRFYRRKYDAAKTLAAFGSRLREETDLDALSSDMVEVARGTMQPAHVSLWLRPDAEPEARSPALRQEFGHDE